MAHCDLQHGNVLLVTGSQKTSLAVKLIDYDGMFVPALARSKSGEVGHPNYQHPERLREGTYNGLVDRFPLLVIATALQALSVGGRELWERYDNGDNLLFKETDLRAPGESALFKELQAIDDPATQALVERLLKASTAPLDETPPIEEMVVIGDVKAAPARPAVKTAPSGKRETGEAAGNIVRLKKRTAKKATGTPKWVWGAVAGVVVLLLAGIGAFAFMGKKKTGNKAPVVVQTSQPQTTRAETAAPVVPAEPAPGGKDDAARLEQERLDKEKAERERLEKLGAEQERVAKDRAERERLDKERAERERLDKERAEAEVDARVAALERELAAIDGDTKALPDKVPAPMARWSFVKDASDSIGALHGTLVGGTVVENGRLH